MITADSLRSIMPLAGKYADVYAPLLSATADANAINTPQRMAAFLANLAVESMQLTCAVESCNYRDPARLLALFPHDFKDLADAQAVQARGERAIASRIYANQNGNGDEASGDGWLYRGRSLAQITGKRNYVIVGHVLELDLLNHPELLETPEHAANAAGMWWDNNRLNDYADAGQFQAICAIWNVGNARVPASAIIGFQDRARYYSRARDVFQLVNQNQK
jgi:putative chitinase